MREDAVPGRGPHAWPLVVCLLCAVAIAPLLRADSPCGHDTGLHYYRIVAMRRALQDGMLFTRYLPDLAFGYGHPFFNFRGALSYYLALIPYLTGLALPVCLNLVYVLSIAGSALGAYLWARDLLGPQGGIVAAVAYACAPYQFLDALLRANAPESLALALLPFILWAFRRLALTGERRWLFASTGSLAALYLTHNISSLLFTPLLIAYLGALRLVYRRKGHWATVGIALALALGLSAFFLGPALLEKRYVQLHLSHSNRNNDFHYNFLGSADLLSMPASLDTSLMNPPARFDLGLIQAALALVGLAVGLVGSRDRERRVVLAFLALAASTMIWMATNSSAWVWEHAPLLRFVQFPWRLIGRAALPLAMLAGAAIPSGRDRVSRVLLLFAVGLLILAAFPYTYPPQGYCDSPPRPTINDLFAYERRSGLVGTDPTGSYFPVWVREKPTGSPLEDQYAAGRPVTRFDETSLPEGGAVIEADYSPNRARLVVETPTAFRARYLAFYFPGWRVSVDGEPVAAAPTDPGGLISFDVPAGQHTVVVRFGSTPIRTALTGVLILSLATVAVLAAWYPFPRAGDRQRAIASHSGTELLSLLLLGLALLMLKLVIVDRVKNPFRHPALGSDGRLSGIERVLNQPYADGLTLLGYDQAGATVPADGVLRFDLYWTARADPGANYQSVIHLVGADGLRWSHRDSFRPRGYTKYPPTSVWGPGRYALDSQEVEPLPGAPPGTYDVVLTTFDKDTLAPLSLLDEQSQPAAPELVLGQVTLTRLRRRVEPPQIDRIDLPLGDLILISASFDREEADPGDPVLVTTFWEAARQPGEDLTFRLTLLGADGSPAVEHDLAPSADWHPTSEWQAGDIWRGQHLLRLPADLSTGIHTWTVRLAESPGYPVGRLSVTSPQRTFTSPPYGRAVNVTLGGLATLVGFTLEPESRAAQVGDTLTVTLVWLAEGTSGSSHHVFLHLTGPDGSLVAQSDGVPASWARPTTGWLLGEYVTDMRVLAIPADAPAGDYVLTAGLYVPGGERLATPEGADAVSLATVTVRRR